jgi:type IV pilus assembly protein PilP
MKGPALGLALLFGFAAACEDKVATSSDSPSQPAAATSPGPAAGDAGVAEGGTASKVEVHEGELAESDKSRDPFRSYAAMFSEEGGGRLKSQRSVVLDNYAIEDLKLIGIVTRIHPAKAMLVDPTGKGHVVQRGQLIGRPEMTQPAGPGTAAYEVNWRIDRIRDGDIVLIREDPQNPDVPAATRVIPLRAEGSIVGGE